MNGSNPQVIQLKVLAIKAMKIGCNHGDHLSNRGPPQRCLVEMEQFPVD